MDSDDLGCVIGFIVFVLVYIGMCTYFVPKDYPTSIFVIAFPIAYTAGFVVSGAVTTIVKAVSDFADRRQLRERYRKAEFLDIMGRCRQHPDKDIEDVVREAVSDAKYWTFKTVWKKIRDSYDGRIFTGIFR